MTSTPGDLLARRAHDHCRLKHLGGLLQRSWLGLKDKFHKNSEFYSFDKPGKPEKTDVGVSKVLHSLEGLTDSEILQKMTLLQTNQFRQENGGLPNKKTVEVFGIKAENAIENLKFIKKEHGVAV